MKAIRRSLKGEKDNKHHHVSITPKSAIAILPPKKVIKALYDHTPAPDKPHELAFSKGDFFHVISREDDPNWYEACNPLHPNARGLVPVSFFEVIAKNERHSAGSVHAPEEHRQEPHDSGFSDHSGHGRADSTNTTRHGAQVRMSAIGKNSGAMVYGVVVYDFKAERADELEAKAGEAIIVIAQSNPEWFVAKPIGRLGGPGLIPVSFIEIRDMTSGKAVTDPHEAVQRAGVPRVEEWKKMTAEYKNSSITLGKFESGGGVNQAAADLEKMGLNNTGMHNGNDYYHQRNGSKGFSQQNQNYQQQQQQQQQGYYPVVNPVKACIPRYCFDNDKYWYIIEAQMEDGRWWELSRYYHDFYDFQIALLSTFEDEAGNNGKPRTLPFMPGPVTQVTNAISNGRRQNLDEYIKKLLSMPPHISRCQLVRQLFAPRPGDFEIDPAVADEYRLSTGSQQSSGHGQSRTASRQSSQGQMSSGNFAHPGANNMQQQQQQRRTHQRSQGSLSQASSGKDLRHEPQHPPSMSRQGSSFAQIPSHQPAPVPVQPLQNTGAMKVKVFFQDDIIVIRVPTDIALRQLREKIQERLKVDNDILLRYKDEPSSSFVELMSDTDLENAIRRNAKLNLYAGFA
ncbi:bud emergence protein 1 [Myotisia sp. PD_48]|nr:bud emergence protein 1 [Myotisia sp. PD_48]